MTIDALYKYTLNLCIVQIFISPFLKLKVVSSYSQESYWEGFPDGSLGKESICSTGDRRCGFDPSVGKISWSRQWQPTPVFLSGESCGQRSLASFSPWGHRVQHDWATNTCAISVSTFDFYHQVKNNRFCQTEYCFSLLLVRLLETVFKFGNFFDVHASFFSLTLKQALLLVLPKWFSSLPPSLCPSFPPCPLFFLFLFCFLELLLLLSRFSLVRLCATP